MQEALGSILSTAGEKMIKVYVGIISETCF
jgi:hypothetical protein